jgi:hypothetical protein
MKYDPAGFWWDVYTGGHRWEDGSRGDGRVLVRPYRTPDRRRYFPLRSEPSLFLTFIETEIIEEGIVAFADRFGLLGNVEEEGRPIAMRFVPPGESQEVWGEGDYYQDWAAAISEMRPAVRVWQAVQCGDAGRLDQFLDEAASEIDRLLSEATGVPVNSVPLGARRRRDPQREAVEFVALSINHHLERFAAPRVAWSPGEGRLGFSVAPKMLLGAMWLQFAWAAVGNARYRPCKSCGRLFEVSLAASRTDRLTCSDTCRAKAYRERRDRAREMYAGGDPVKAIAAALGCKPDAVRGWVKGTKRGGRSS